MESESWGLVAIMHGAHSPIFIDLITVIRAWTNYCTVLD